MGTRLWVRVDVSELRSLFKEERMQVQAPPGEKGVLEGEADDAPPAQPEGQVRPTEEGSGRTGAS